MIEQFNANKPSRVYEPEEEINAFNNDLWVRAMIEQFNANKSSRGYELEEQLNASKKDLCYEP